MCWPIAKVGWLSRGRRFRAGGPGGIAVVFRGRAGTVSEVSTSWVAADVPLRDAGVFEVKSSFSRNCGSVMPGSQPTRSAGPSRRRQRFTSRRLRGPLAQSGRRRVARRARRRRVWLYHSAPEGRAHAARDSGERGGDASLGSSPGSARLILCTHGGSRFGCHGHPLHRHASAGSRSSS